MDKGQYYSEFGVLSNLMQQKKEVAVFLMNGYKLKGVITGFDGKMVDILSGGSRMHIYKHAISTIAEENTKNQANLSDFP